MKASEAAAIIIVPLVFLSHLVLLGAIVLVMGTISGFIQLHNRIRWGRM